MSCENFAADLSAWIDRELPAPRSEALETHVASCAPCRARAEALRRADAALHAIPLRELAPDALAQLARRIERAEPAAPRRAPARRQRRWLGWSAGAGAAAAAAAFALHFVARPDPLESASPEDLAVAIDLDNVEDLDVIANLEVLERMVALDEDRG